MDTLNWQESGGGITFSVRVVPRAGRDEIVGVEGGELKVRLMAPPVRGKANESLVKFLSATLGVRYVDVEILRGETSRHKRVRVRGANGDLLKRILNE